MNAQMTSGTRTALRAASLARGGSGPGPAVARAILALAALFAVGAMMAPAAHAAPGKFTATSYPVTVTGDQDGGTTKFVFGKEVRVITCTTIAYKATITAAVESLTMAPGYSGCAMDPAFGPIDIRTHNCTFTYSVPNAASNVASMDVTNCPESAPFELEITQQTGEPLCRYELKNQTGISGVKWNNRAGTPEDVTLEFLIKPVWKVLVGGQIVCGAKVGGDPGITIAGASTVTAFKDISGIEGEAIALMVG